MGSCWLSSFDNHWHFFANAVLVNQTVLNMMETERHESWLTSFEMGACGLNWQNNSINVGTFSVTQLYSFGSRSQFNRTSSLQFRCCIFFLSWRSVGRFNSSWKQMHRTCMCFKVKTQVKTITSMVFAHSCAHVFQNCRSHIIPYQFALTLPA